MASVTRSHRKAYGPHRAMSSETKARNVAASILEHRLDVAAPATWARYGLQANVERQALVLAALQGRVA